MLATSKTQNDYAVTLKCVSNLQIKFEQVIFNCLKIEFKKNDLCVFD